MKHAMTLEHAMQKSEAPTAFGVFKPVGHVVMAFAPEADVSGAEEELQRNGLAGSDVVHYEPQEIVAQTERNLAHAGALSSLGQEQNLVKAHRALAERGSHFLVVHAEDDKLARTVAEVGQRYGAVRAQKYGRFVIEELIDLPEEMQHAESASRGLDSQGVEPGKS
jgi:hypothetical protein